jgi:glycosyltransferase involved in cell wall biosynthesis
MTGLRLAVISPMYNEEVLVGQFLNHYAPQVDTVFLMDNESTDSSVKIALQYPNVQVSTFRSGGQYNDSALTAAKLGKKRECVGLYDYVLLVDIDEFVVPKQGGTIRHTMEGMKQAEIYGTHGYNMFKRPEEPRYDPDCPLLIQRHWGIESIAHYSKPIIIRPESTATYCNGFHDVIDRNNALLKTPEHARFYLLHFIGVDEDLFVERAMARSLRMSADNLKNGWSCHYFDRDKEVYRQWFRRESMSQSAVYIQIPQ